MLGIKTVNSQKNQPQTKPKKPKPQTHQNPKTTHTTSHLKTPNERPNKMTFSSPSQCLNWNVLIAYIELLNAEISGYLEA